jgi:hypothetical protein
VRRFAGLLAIALALSSSACARPVGDFGRAAPDPIHDQVMPALGTGRALLGKEPVSAFNLSDEEREMRDRIWHYLVAPHAFDWFQANVVELQRTRILPVSGKSLLPQDRYYLWLHGERFASSATRYARIEDDVTVDVELMPSVFASICAVLEQDRQRGVAANGIADLDEATKRNAAARQIENRTQIGWFAAAVQNRYASYNYALDHLLVETPHRAAIGVNGALNELAVWVEAAGRGDYCSGGWHGGRGTGGGAALPSRMLLPERPVKGS